MMPWTGSNSSRHCRPTPRGGTSRSSSSPLSISPPKDRRRLNGGVEQILSKSAHAPAELMKRVGALLGEAKRKAK
jgi:hypothetical protein